MNIQKLTQIVMTIALIGLLGYDCFALVKGGTEGTISHWMIVNSYNYPLIPFFWGFLMGHFFWRLRDTAATKDLGRKISIVLGLMVLSTPAFAVTLNPFLDGSDQVRFVRYIDASREVEKVVNSQEFKDRVLGMTFTSTKLSSPEVLDKIFQAEELLTPGKNGVWEWGVGFYSKIGTKVIGYTTPKMKTVWVNKIKFDKFEIWEIADNITHEYLHKIGFDHSSASDRTSVPYAIGYLVRDLVKKNLQEPAPIQIKDPVKDPAPTRRSWWVRLRSYLFGG